MRKKKFSDFSFQIFFSDFERKIFLTFGQKTSKSCQNYLLRVRRNSLWLEFFILKFWIFLDFLQKPSSWFSKFFLHVQSKNCGRNSFLIFLFRNFFGFWANIFSDFRRKIFPNLSKLPSAWPEEQFVAWIVFQKFWTVLDFLQKPLAWFSIFYLHVQSKNCGRNSFLIFLFRIFFGFWANIFSDFRPKNFKKLSKQPSTCPEEQFVAWNFSLKFWIVLDFLQKPSAWFSNFYLRVQSKIAEETVFLFFFSDFERKLFQTFGEKSSKSCQNYLLRVQRNNLWLEIFFKTFESFWIFCRNLWHGSQISIYVSRVKIAEEKVFWFFFSDFFSDFERKIFLTFGQKTSKSCQNYLLRVRRNSLWLEFFILKFWIVLDFLQKPSSWFSKFFLRVQSKNCGRNSFRIFLFRIFSDFERKNFQTFGQKTSKSCQNYLLRVQRNSLWLEIFL